MGPGWNFLLLCVHYIPLLIFFNIELLRKRNIFGGGGGGGGGRERGKLVFRCGDKLVFGDFPPNETLVCVCVDSPAVVG